ncbi:MAG TPA: NUDIX domain-containing protein [Anaerolineaceae bacterium]|nr:NUDIX domain-containing protein [Anaerolineaceae bacterium]
MIEKVVALIVRKKGQQLQLLIFKHPANGYQLPAGTVEENEDLEVALRREVAEETGLTNIKVIQKLGEKTIFLDQNQAVLTQTLRFFSWPAQAAKRHGPLCTRGLKVNTFERKVGFTHVRYEEFDLSKEPPTLLWDSEGWVPSEFLTREIRRHFYLLSVADEDRDHWKIQSDFGYIFECQWVDVDAIPALSWEQSEWLTYLADVNLGSL